MSIIDDVLKILPMEFLKKSSDEVEMRGSESKYDTRRLNSYPSKVLHGHGPHLPCLGFSENFQAVYGHFICTFFTCHSQLVNPFQKFSSQNPRSNKDSLLSLSLSVYLSLSFSPSHTHALSLSLAFSLSLSLSLPLRKAMSQGHALLLGHVNSFVDKSAISRICLVSVVRNKT